MIRSILRAYYINHFSGVSKLTAMTYDILQQYSEYYTSYKY